MGKINSFGSTDKVCDLRGCKKFIDSFVCVANYLLHLGVEYNIMVARVLQIPNQLHFFTKIGDFYTADVKNLGVR